MEAIARKRSRFEKRAFAVKVSLLEKETR